MKTKMTAVAMVAVMIVAAFAVVGMTDSGAADENNAKKKNILGTADNPYILNYSADPEKNKPATASIEFNRSAFTEHATIDFSCTSNKMNNKGEPIANSNVVNIVNASENKKTITIESNLYTITLKNENDVTKNGTYAVTILSSGAETANIHTEFLITLTVTDSANPAAPTAIPLPPQTYTFKVYIKAVDASKESIQFKGDNVDNNANKINFEFETDYSISSKVVVNGTDSAEDFNYYAVGLPDGISMTVDGNIGGRLSNSLKKTTNDVSFTVYAVSTTGHVVSQPMTYSIGEKADRRFTISFDGEDYATTTVNKNVTLTITPNDGSTLKNVVVSYDKYTETFETIAEKKNCEIRCTGTGVLKVSVSAQVEGSNVTLTKTVTVYVVGKIVDTDLDPEVTN